MSRVFKLLIDGQLVDGASRLDVFNPATGKVFQHVPKADEAQALSSIAAAKKAFSAWAALTYTERAAYVIRFAEAIEANAEDLIRMLTREQGKPLEDARFEVLWAAANLKYHAAQELKTKVIRETAAEKIIEQRSPLGVVVAIAPWNFPVWILMSKIGAALMTGNTAIGKPAPTTPITTLMLGELAASIFPAGVFQTLVDENELGPLLTSHPDVAYVSFTGSTETGKKVLNSTVATLKRSTLELGGNDVAIVLDDADIKTVAPKVFRAGFLNAGQICFAAKRVYVPNLMMKAFVAELVNLAQQARPGDGFDATTTLGPVQNKAQYDKVRAFIDEAKDQGAVVVSGQQVPEDGYFIAPTIVTGLADTARLVTEEQFGPVLPILGYDNLDELILRANDSNFGLGASVWTSNTDRGIEVASRIEAGTVWINTHVSLPFDVPFGGAKQSGIGQQGGIEGMQDYTQVRIVNAALA
ncbi:aldehyde dehydrogenase [Pseudomonas azotoformans]|jgi:acyl-CoA reductase-like NAD-dependent aldehyde dehydrogenase|uniref:Aldehyde dehydrogenase n=2 Tax=Pseudomonas TaxID=286 RepID=A0A1V2JSR9_PSEAZ|nr:MULTISPECIES: aldehyde dehydrogenase family protein [Pseudomonas]NWC75023.1 aldehyde dehydrogenase family protein [Pseudomonas sp. P7759]NWD82540.1 aldehyde dehydrogenase family protein [Pseudomonas reactans]NWE86703.1 aldehyde dehydrogenase family protein [Pseudomonas reactans]OIN44597.1 aldehyde dehydrogenase [Pseudomonas azotoformans]ONH47816.1 aldehyde dehydrogenase [Pseudomonas azotoformans]